MNGGTSPASARRVAAPPGGATTFDLFSWNEGPDSSQQGLTSPRAEPNATSDPNGCESPVGRPTIRMHQPAGGLSTIRFGEHLSPEEAEALNKRKPLSDTKMKEMFGSGILSDKGDTTNAGVPERTSVRMHQPAGGASQILFGKEDCVSPKVLTSIHEVAKQKELSGTSETTADLQQGRSHSNAKNMELSGSNIFGPPPVIPPRSLNRSLEELAVSPKEVVKQPDPAPRNVRTSVKVSNPAGGRSQILFGQDSGELSARKVHDQKVAELSGNNIFKGNETPASADKSLSVAKLREMSGSDIFADEKPAGRDCLGGIRKPPGGESSIALI